MRCIPHINVTGFEKPLRKMSQKTPYKSCPGGDRMCPSYLACYIKGNGDRGCTVIHLFAKLNTVSAFNHDYVKKMHTYKYI